MIRILLFGGLSVTRDDRRALSPAATQPRRLAILAMVAAAGERGISRDRLHSLFWPDADDAAARRGLTQALYGLRTGTDAEDLFLGVQELQINRSIATCDVFEYGDAIEGGEWERAAMLYRGPFLDGFRLPGAPEFNQRVDEQRIEFATRHESLLERLAGRATKNGEPERAVEWWRQRVSMDRFNARVTEAYMRALAAAGDYVGAIRHARVHAQLYEQEFGTPPSAAVAQLLAQLQADLKLPLPITPAPVSAPASAPAPVAVVVMADGHADAISALPNNVKKPTPSASRGVSLVVASGRVAWFANRPWRVILQSGAIVVCLTAFALWRTGKASRVGIDGVDMRRVRVSAATRVAADAALELDAAISPEGRHIAYVVGDEGAMRLYVRQRDGSRAVPIAESVPGDQRRPHWSPDGASIVFQSATGIWIVPALGGTARMLVESSTPKQSATSPAWSHNGLDIAWVSRDSIYRMAVAGGTPRFVASVPLAHSLAWSPDGKWIAAVSGNTEFAVGARGDLGQGGVGIGNLAPSGIVLILASDSTPARSNQDRVRLLIPPLTLNASPAWLDRRTLIFVSSRGGTRDLFGAHISDDGSIRGDVERITAGLDAHSVSASADGRQLAYTVFRQAANVWSLPVRVGTPMTSAMATRVTSGTQVVEGLDVSTDGRWLAYDADVDGQQDIFRLPLQDGAAANRDAERIVSSPVDDFHPAWSPDARWVAFYAFRDGVRRAAYVSATGGTMRLVHPGGPNVEEHSPVWSSDGKSLFYFRQEHFDANLFRTDRINDTTWSPARRLTSSGGLAASFSADGRQMVYFSTASTIRLADSSYSENTSHEILSPTTSSQMAPRATSARITPDGRALIVKGYDVVSSGFWRYPLTDGVLGPPSLLVRFDDPRRLSPRPEFTTDGRHLYFALSERAADVWVLKLDWP